RPLPPGVQSAPMTIRRQGDALLPRGSSTEGMFMDERIDCPLAGVLAARLRDARDPMTQRWLERIASRVTIEPGQIFPSQELLDHVPLLVDGIADYMEDPADEISADVPVIAKAMELGELRLAQGFGVHQIL